MNRSLELIRGETMKRPMEIHEAILMLKILTSRNQDVFNTI